MRSRPPGPTPLLTPAQELELSGYTLFAREFLRSPWTTASLVPSSAALTRLSVAPLPERDAPVVLELGAGTGVTTAAVQRHLAGRGRHIAVETNPRMARLLQRHEPTVEVYCEDARETVHRLAGQGTRVDLVISTLPQSVTAPAGSTIFARLGPLMGPHGVVTQVQHSWVRPLPRAQGVRRRLEEHFHEVGVSPTVWRNLPPAVVYTARRPRAHA